MLPKILVLDCFEIPKQATYDNAILHEQHVISPLECYDICENNRKCKFFLINHRKTNMRGCWLLKSDPHSEKAMLQSKVIGPSSCSKYKYRIEPLHKSIAKVSKLNLKGLDTTYSYKPLQVKISMHFGMASHLYGTKSV